MSEEVAAGGGDPPGHGYTHPHQQNDSEVVGGEAKTTAVALPTSLDGTSSAHEPWVNGHEGNSYDSHLNQTDDGLTSAPTALGAMLDYDSDSSSEPVSYRPEPEMPVAKPNTEPTMTEHANLVTVSEQPILEAVGQNSASDPPESEIPKMLMPDANNDANAEHNQETLQTAQGDNTSARVEEGAPTIMQTENHGPETNESRAVDIQAPPPTDNSEYTNISKSPDHPGHVEHMQYVGLPPEPPPHGLHGDMAHVERLPDNTGHEPLSPPDHEPIEQRQNGSANEHTALQGDGNGDNQSPKSQLSQHEITDLHEQPADPHHTVISNEIQTPPPVSPHLEISYPSEIDRGPPQQYASTERFQQLPPHTQPDVYTGQAPKPEPVISIRSENGGEGDFEQSTVGLNDTVGEVAGAGEHETNVLAHDLALQSVAKGEGVNGPEPHEHENETTNEPNEQSPTTAIAQWQHVGAMGDSSREHESKQKVEERPKSPQHEGIQIEPKTETEGKPDGGEMGITDQQPPPPQLGGLPSAPTPTHTQEHTDTNTHTHSDTQAQTQADTHAQAQTLGEGLTDHDQHMQNVLETLRQHYPIEDSSQIEQQTFTEQQQAAVEAAYLFQQLQQHDPHMQGVGLVGALEGVGAGASVGVEVGGDAVGQPVGVAGGVWEGLPSESAASQPAPTQSRNRGQRKRRADFDDGEPVHPPPLLNEHVWKRDPTACTVRNKCTSLGGFLALMGMRYKTPEEMGVAAGTQPTPTPSVVVTGSQAASEDRAERKRKKRREAEAAKRQRLGSTDVAGTPSTQRGSPAVSSVRGREEVASPMNDTWSRRGTHGSDVRTHNEQPSMAPHSPVFPLELHEEQCRVCSLEGNLVGCSACEASFHPLCLFPPRQPPLPARWKCQQCEPTSYPWRFDPGEVHQLLLAYDSVRDSEIEQLRRRAAEIKEANAVLAAEARQLTELAFTLSSEISSGAQKAQSARGEYFALEAETKALCVEVTAAIEAKKKKPQQLPQNIS